MKRANNENGDQNALEFARRTSQRRIRLQSATSSEHTILSNPSNQARLQRLSSIIQEVLDILDDEPDFLG
jgi:hypothetical protein